MAGLIVVDTNVISAIMGPVAISSVAQWLGSIPLASLRTTAVNEAEIRYGIARLPTGRRKLDLASLADQFFLSIGRPLPFDHAAALRYAEIASAKAATGVELDIPDIQIAAIASIHGATIATRNVRDFMDCMVEIVNPWNFATREVRT